MTVEVCVCFHIRVAGLFANQYQLVERYCLKGIRISYTLHVYISVLIFCCNILLKVLLGTQVEYIVFLYSRTIIPKILIRYPPTSK